MAAGRKETGDGRLPVGGQSVGSASHGRARGSRPPMGTAPTPAARVAAIVRMMSELRWGRGRSARELAAEWGVAEATVERDASEAARLLGLIGETDALRETALVHLLTIAERGETDRVPALRVALEAAGLLRQRVDVRAEVADLRTQPRERIYETALSSEDFRAWLVAKGWREPIITTGESHEAETPRLPGGSSDDR